MKEASQTFDDLNARTIYFKDSKVVHAANDGLQILGHFLLSQVGADRSNFFIKWLKEKQNDTINSGPYYLQKVIDPQRGDVFIIEHIEHEDVVPFQASPETMIDILKHWNGLCNSQEHSLCGVGGHNVSLTRSEDGKSFTFHTHTVH